MSSPRPVLVIDDGDLPSLLACAAAAADVAGATPPGEGPQIEPVVWVPGGQMADGDVRARAARRHAEVYGLAILEAPPISAPAGAPEAEQATRTVVEGALLAARLGYEAVVWPVHTGPGVDPDLDRVAAAVDRALLVSRLVSLGGPGDAGIQVRVPYADFTDRQIADLALDLDLPVWTCWWWEAAGDAARAERRRWLEVLEKAGWVDRRGAPVPAPAPEVNVVPAPGAPGGPRPARVLRRIVP